MKKFIQKICCNWTFAGSLIAVVVFAAISWLYFYPDAMQGKVLRQHDTLQGVANGHEVKAYEAETGETSRWTNSLFSGMPNFQINPSYSSSKLVSWIGRAYSLWFPSPVDYVFIMMLGFYIMLLAFKVRWYLAILGAIGWAFSTYFFIIIGAGHIWKYITLAYIPPTIAGIVWAYRGKYLAGGTVAALFATLQLASNHVQMTYYFLVVIFAIVVAFLVSAIKEKKIGQWGIATGVLAVAAILALAANSPNLYNTYKYSKETMRGGSELKSAAADAGTSKGGLEKDYITMWSYGIDETLTLLVPNAKGGANVKPEKGNNLPLMLSATDQAKEMSKSGDLDSQQMSALNSFYQYFGDQPGTNGPVYVGALIFALFILGLIIVKGPMKWALLAVTILTVMLSWGHNMMWLTDWFIDHFPMYNKFRTVSSILVVAEFTMPLLAILALQKLLTAEDVLRQYRVPLFVSFGVSAFICFLMMVAPQMLVGNGFSTEEFNYYTSQGMVAQFPDIFEAVANVRLKMVSTDALRSLMILLVAFVAIMLYAYRKMSFKLVCGVIALVLFFDMFSINKRYLNTDTFAEPMPVAAQPFEPRNADKQILADTDPNYRVLDLTAFDNAMPSYFHKTIGGYHAAKLARYQDIIDRHLRSKEGPNMNVVNMLNAKYVIVDADNAHLNPEALGNAWFVDKVEYVDTPDAEINALNTIDPARQAVADAKFKNVIGNAVAVDSTYTIAETSYAPNRLEYHYNAPAEAVAVFSEVYFPWGWTATVDGQELPIGRVNYILRALRLPAGEHNVTFTFDPQSVHATETAAYVAIIIIYIAFLAMIGLAIYRRMKVCDDKQKE